MSPLSSRLVPLQSGFKWQTLLTILTNWDDPPKYPPKCQGIFRKEVLGLFDLGWLETWPDLEMVQGICQETRAYEGMTGWLSWWYSKNRGILNIPNSTMCQMGSNHLGLHSLELTYPPKMQVFNRNLLSQGSIFRGYVSFREGNSVFRNLLVNNCLDYLKPLRCSPGRRWDPQCTDLMRSENWNPSKK